jgi:NAD-dependent SIR2 family protein deacetylase
MGQRNVFVLGAGASCEAGGPLIKDFFSRGKESDASVYARRFDDDEKYLVLEAIYRDWAAKEEGPDVEKFFRYLSVNKTTGLSLTDPRTGSRISPETLERYLTWYIASYVQHSIAWHRKIPRQYYRFADFLSRRGIEPAILTFNYDMVLEKAIIAQMGGVDYRLGKIRGLREFSDTSSVPFIKLHGSLNWRKCTKCKEIYVYDHPVAHIFKRERCSSRCDGFINSVIVPPVPDKGAYLGSSNHLWNEANKVLQRADYLTIIGYSLPAIDEVSEELLRRAVKSNEDMIIDIVNPEISVIDDIGRRLGLGGVDTGPTPRYLPLNCTFKQYVEEISKNKRMRG